MMNWTRCADALPDDEMAVLVATDDGEVWPGFHEADEWFYVSGDPMTGAQYWTQLPAHPEAA